MINPALSSILDLLFLLLLSHRRLESNMPCLWVSYSLDDQSITQLSLQTYSFSINFIWLWYEFSLYINQGKGKGESVSAWAVSSCVDLPSPGSHPHQLDDDIYGMRFMQPVMRETRRER